MQKTTPATLLMPKRKRIADGVVGTQPKAKRKAGRHVADRRKHYCAPEFRPHCSTCTGEPYNKRPEFDEREYYHKNLTTMYDDSRELAAEAAFLARELPGSLIGGGEAGIQIVVDFAYTPSRLRDTRNLFKVLRALQPSVYGRCMVFGHKYVARMNSNSIDHITAIHKRNQQVQWCELPAEVLQLCFSYLGTYCDWYHARRVCKDWAAVAQRRPVKRQVALRAYSRCDLKTAMDDLMKAIQQSTQVAIADGPGRDPTWQRNACSNVRTFDINKIMDNMADWDVRRLYGHLAFVVLGCNDTLAYLSVLEKFTASARGSVASNHVLLSSSIFTRTLHNQPNFACMIYWTALLTLLGKAPRDADQRITEVVNSYFYRLPQPQACVCDNKCGSIKVKSLETGN